MKVESNDSMESGGGVDLVLQRLHRPVRLLPHPKYVRELAYFIRMVGIRVVTADERRC